MNLANGKSTAVECLGKTFTDDNERRAYFRAKLREFLANPVFRSQDGFPVGSDDDIVELSDPPYFTMCPNPFLTELIEHVGRDYNKQLPYAREPLAIDVSEGKTDPLYRAHGYHTKVPHQAIVPSILHYTEPGDVIFDGFSGSGMTALAAQFCEHPPKAYKEKVEASCKINGRRAPEWGRRYAILNDLSPAAGFIAANYTSPFDLVQFEHQANRLLKEVSAESGWMYKTTHTDGSVCDIEYTVWSQIYNCPECAAELDFYSRARDSSNDGVLENFTCPSCSAELTKSKLDVSKVAYFDERLQTTINTLKRVPVIICYKKSNQRYNKTPDAADLARIKEIEGKSGLADLPLSAFPFSDMWEATRLRAKGVTHVHHMFLARPSIAFSGLWAKVKALPVGRTRNMLIFFVEQAILGMSILARYAPTHFSQVNQYLSGVYYVGSQVVDVSPGYILEGKLKRLIAAFRGFVPSEGSSWIGVGSSTHLAMPDKSIDYIFTDPPFGDNIPYSELNFVVESFLGVITNATSEAVVDRSKENPKAQKGIDDYRMLLTAVFSEYFRVLKPGRWMTVVFSNTSAAVWNSIQNSLQTAGFVVSNVSTLDKKQLGFKAITTTTAVKQDLVISAYKPNGGLEERFAASGGTDESAWDFVQTHLKNLPISKMRGGVLEDVPERDPRRIFDRMVAWFVKHNSPVPLSSAEFQVGISQRFPERDGMIFLPAQVDEYDKRRLSLGTAPQRDLFVDDERSAIDWLSDFLKSKPSTSQDINPFFTQKLGAGWRKYEQRPELARLLEDNFLKYDGAGPVPNQIHTYLSSNWRELRGLDKNSPSLVERAKDRWYVGDPNKQQDVEKRRDRALLKEFERYRSHTGKKLKEVRLEVLRTGFKAAWAAREYQVILDVANRVAEDIWQEDEKLLTFYDMAETRLRDGK